MLNKVFLVEDEIVAREGIRDNVDWQSVGFEFCGEAPDGEVALPLIESTQPDVLITDIKMPFMDGLQLCKIVRERMPWIKIIILSGHDEFNYAQEAVKLGVTEYLLKPIGVQDVHKALQKVAAQLEQERKEKQSLQELQDEVEENRAMLRDSFLLKLVMGAISPTEAIEKSQLLDIDIIARCYQVIVVKAALSGCAGPFDYYEYEQTNRLVTGLVENNPDILAVQKDMEELVLIIKGNNPEYLAQEGYFLTELIKSEIGGKTKCSLSVGIGHPQNRLGNIHISFTEALANLQDSAQANGAIGPDNQASKTELLKLDKSILEDYLKFGIKGEFDAFFAAYLYPFSEAALNSYTIKNYIFIDIVLVAAKFVNKLGGNIDQVIAEIHDVETLLMNIKTIDEIREQTRKILVNTLEFRDSQANNQYAEMIHQARTYIKTYYSNPDLSLNEVATHVNLSPSHFSAVFSRETGETFKEYLTRVRIRRAKELLRTTSLKSFEISYQIGYKDPHYFSYAFKRQTGLSPKKFRSQAKTT